MSYQKLVIHSLDKRNGMLNLTKDMLFKWENIENVCIKLNIDNNKFFDELTGFPSGDDSCVGILHKEETDETK